MECEICGSDDWKQLRGGWARCLTCGRLETTIKTKKCRLCQRDLGRYSKRNQKLCVECRSTSTPEALKIECSTKGCFNKTKKAPTPNPICKQCSLESEEQEGLHLWKEKALEASINEPTQKELRQLIQKDYPSISETKIGNWFRKLKKNKKLCKSEGKPQVRQPAQKFIPIKVSKHKQDDK